MASPFSWFRKHQAILMAVFVIAILVVFTIGTSIQQMATLGSGGGRAADVVVTWKHGDVTQSDLLQMRTTRRMLNEYTDALFQAALKRQSDVTLNRRLAISYDTSSQGVFTKMVMAEKARELGIVVSDDAIEAYLQRLTGNALSLEQMDTIRKRRLNKVAKPMLYDALREELMAINLANMAYSGEAAITPVAAWQYYDRWTRTVNAEFVPFKVDDYLSKVAEEPTEEELQELYEEHKNRTPDPESPLPGFRRRPRAIFGYLEFDYDKLVLEEKLKITQQQIEEHYEKNKDLRYVVREPDVDPDDPRSAIPSPPVPPTEADDPSPDGEDTTGEGGEATDSETSDGEPTDGDAPPSNGEEIPGSSTDDAPSEGDNDAEGGSAEIQPLQDDPADDGEKVNESPVETETESDAAGSEADKDDEATAEPSGEPKDAGDPELPPQGTDSNTEGTDPGDTTGGDETTTTGGSESDPAEPETEEEKPKKYKPLEEVADDIRGELALEPANDRLEEMLTTARKAIKDYHNDLLEHDSIEGIEHPGELNAKKIAQEVGAVYHETKMVDSLDLRLDEENNLARSSQASTQPRGRREGFLNLAFRPGREPYAPFATTYFTRDEETNETSEKRFLTWKIDGEEGFVPEFDDIREEVTAAWRREQARELAKQAAEELAKQVRGSTKTLAEAAPAGAKVFKPAPFGFFSAETKQFHRIAPGQIPLRGDTIEGIEDATSLVIKEQVIGIPDGGVDVVANQAKDTYYTAFVIGSLQSEQARRARFLQDIADTGPDLPLPRDWLQMAGSQQNNNYQLWLNSLFEEMDVKLEDAEYFFGSSGDG